MVGLVTSVISRVGSVTSTCLRSSFGDLRTLSGPMLPLSSGTLPGQISTTNGSAASAVHATINETNTARAEAIGCMVKILLGSRWSKRGHDRRIGAIPNTQYAVMT